MKVMKIWLDDERSRPDRTWVPIKHSNICILLLKACKRRDLIPESISLDHDLGGDDTSRAVVLWMCENDFWPKTVYVHTANPVGRDWLVGMVDRYGPGVTR